MFFLKKITSFFCCAAKINNFVELTKYFCIKTLKNPLNTRKYAV